MIKKDNIAEFKGTIINIFEDFADENDIEVKSPDRDLEIESALEEGEYKSREEVIEDMGLARIYGDSYDVIGDLIEDRLNIIIEKDAPMDNTEADVFSEEIIKSFYSLTPNEPTEENIRFFKNELKETYTRLGILKLTKYKVWAKMTSYCYLPVEASSKEEALQIAEETDGGDFISDDHAFSGDWEILEAVKEELEI